MSMSNIRSIIIKAYSTVFQIAKHKEKIPGTAEYLDRSDGSGREFVTDKDDPDSTDEYNTDNKYW